MNFLRFGNIYLFVSGIAIVASIASITFFGLLLGIDFTGGSILEIEYSTERPSNLKIQELLSDFKLGSLTIQPSGGRGVILRMETISEETHQQILSKLGQEAREERFESIGGIIGEELKKRVLLMVVLSLASISLYVAFAFRKIVHPVRSWQWSAIALAALLHDVIITLGALALLGRFSNLQIQIPVVVALLTIIGYSINDTVVIFDRIRENITKKIGFDFANTVNISLQQTIARSISTSFTVLIVVVAILFFGGETLRDFALCMTIGIAVGAYSSIFPAPALLVQWIQGKGVDKSL
ncbi:MAG: protein translocase subunit SecF [Patescibacteria group bacterium]